MEASFCTQAADLKEAVSELCVQLQHGQVTLKEFIVFATEILGVHEDFQGLEGQLDMLKTFRSDGFIDAGCLIALTQKTILNHWRETDALPQDSLKQLKEFKDKNVINAMTYLMLCKKTNGLNTRLTSPVPAKTTAGTHLLLCKNALVILHLQVVTCPWLCRDATRWHPRQCLVHDS